MPLPVIPNPTPVVIPAQPAVEAITYDAIALTSLQVQVSPQATDLLGMSFSCQFSPMCSTVTPNKIMPGMRGPNRQGMSIRSRNVFGEATRSTMFTDIMGYILAYAILALQEQTLIAQIDALTQAGGDATALQASLTTVQTSMGVTPGHNP